MTPITLNINLQVPDALTSAVVSLADALRGLSISNTYITETAQAPTAETPKEETKPVAQAPTPEPAPPTPPAATAKTITPDDIRKAINDARVRLGCGSYNTEGTYIEAPDSDAYKQYNKAISQECIRLSNTLCDGCKPTQLPVEHRQSFIDRLATLIADDKGGLTYSVPY